MSAQQAEVTMVFARQQKALIKSLSPWRHHRDFQCRPSTCPEKTRCPQHILSMRSSYACIRSPNIGLARGSIILMQWATCCKCCRSKVPSVLPELLMTRSGLSMKEARPKKKGVPAALTRLQVWRQDLLCFPGLRTFSHTETSCAGHTRHPLWQGPLRRNRLHSGGLRAYRNGERYPEKL